MCMAWSSGCLRFAGNDRTIAARVRPHLMPARASGPNIPPRGRSRWPTTDRRKTRPGRARRGAVLGRRRANHRGSAARATSPTSTTCSRSRASSSSPAQEKEERSLGLERGPFRAEGSTGCLAVGVRRSRRLGLPGPWLGTGVNPLLTQLSLADARDRRRSRYARQPALPRVPGVSGWRPLPSRVDRACVDDRRLCGRVMVEPTASSRAPSASGPRGTSRASRRGPASFNARIAIASSAALTAPALPIASVPTGIPPGIWTVERSESRPSSADVIGTPSTEASCARRRPPRGARRRRRRRSRSSSRAPPRPHVVGERLRRAVRRDHAALVGHAELLQRFGVPFIVSQSDLLPMRTATSGFDSWSSDADVNPGTGGVGRTRSTAGFRTRRTIPFFRRFIQEKCSPPCSSFP